jgi:hypothetical protein
MRLSNTNYLYTATMEHDIYIIELNPMHVSRRLCPSNMILVVSGKRKLYIFDVTANKIHAFHAYNWLDVSSSNRHYILLAFHANKYILLEKQVLMCISIFSGVASPSIWSRYANFKSLSLFISLEIDCFTVNTKIFACIAELNRRAGYATVHLSDYCSGRTLKKIELSRTIKFSVFQTILDKTLETIRANITKLLNIGKTKCVSPSPQFNVVTPPSSPSSML